MGKKLKKPTQEEMDLYGSSIRKFINPKASIKIPKEPLEYLLLNYDKDIFHKTFVSIVKKYEINKSNWQEKVIEIIKTTDYSKKYF